MSLLTTTYDNRTDGYPLATRHHARLRRWFLLTSLLLPAETAVERTMGHRASALRHSLEGNFRSAEASQRLALASCPAVPCTGLDIAILQGELAGYLLYGGFPEAAIPLWKRMAAATTGPLHASAQMGLGASLHMAGKTAAALDVWRAICPNLHADRVQQAACRFNQAMATASPAAAWSEIEAALPTLLETDNPHMRADALVQSARVALAAGHPSRAEALNHQAEQALESHLGPHHPLWAVVYQTNAAMARSRGQAREGRQWDAKARKATTAAAPGSWQPQTVAITQKVRNEPRK